MHLAAKQDVGDTATIGLLALRRAFTFSHQLLSRT